jgi:putative ABC transport system substrate-binding protein
MVTPRRTALKLALVISLSPLGFPSEAAEPRKRVAVVLPTVQGGRFPRHREAFLAGLRRSGWTEESNLVIAWHDVAPANSVLAETMAQIVSRGTDVIVTTSTLGAAAARHATRTIPIVVVAMGDPVGAGLVKSLARPGDNLTGLSVQTTEGFPGKLLELLRELLPRLGNVAALFNPENPLSELQNRALQDSAGKIGIKVTLVAVNVGTDLDKVFQPIRASDALVVFADPVFATQRRQIVAIVSRERIPAIYGMAEFVQEGGLIAYGPDLALRFRMAASYVDKILRGANPGDLPIQQPNAFTLAINLKTAKALGIKVPQSILVRADEVVQ